MNIEKLMNESVQITITTKDRWPILRETLKSLTSFGLGGFRILIIDDGSETECPYEISSICPGAEHYRFATSANYIARRNQLVEKVDSQYVLQLDDDSFPTSGSLSTAAFYLENNPCVFALTFPVFNPLLNVEQVRSGFPTPYPTRAFIGCAVLFRRDDFLELGGYNEKLVRFGEELDLALRAYRHGYEIRHYPGLAFHHLETQMSRNRWRLDYYGARNNVLLADWYLPLPIGWAKQVQNTWVRFRRTHSTKRTGHWEGHQAGIRDIPNLQQYRQRMTIRQYIRWQRLPTY